MKPTATSPHSTSRAILKRMLFPALALSLLLTGCVKQEAQGETTTYLFETWTCWAGVGTGLLITLIGLCLDKKILLKMILVPGGLILAILAPNTLFQYVRVEPEQFEVAAGSWWTPGKQTVRFAQLVEIRRVTEKRDGVFESFTPARSYLCILKAGGGEKIVRGRLVDEAEDRILENAIAKGVLVSGEWTDPD